MQIAYLGSTHMAILPPTHTPIIKFSRLPGLKSLLSPIADFSVNLLVADAFGATLFTQAAELLRHAWSDFREDAIL